MAGSASSPSGGNDTETPLLIIENTVAVAVAVAVDYKGRPALRSNSGGWRSASFIIGVEVAERFAYYGISANLITYLTGPLRKSTAAAAANVNAWSGTASMLPLFGAFVADSFLGRYRTIVVASLLYIMGLGLLSLSAIFPSWSDLDCQTNTTMLCSPPSFQVTLFFFSLYLVAIAQSGHKPCTQAFGADQFDSRNPTESKAKSSFFNWWYFGACAGSLVTIVIVSYIQENLSWALGFGVPCLAMVFALAVFLLGTASYRYSVIQEERSAFVRIGGVFVAAFRNRARDRTGELFRASEQFEFLNKALIATSHSKENGRSCSEAEVEEAKAVLRLIPIWATCLVFGVVFAQTFTFFTKQGATMERTIISGIKIPAASLHGFIYISILAVIPIYDKVFVPIARALTRAPTGITVLQRIGTGIFLSIFSMVVAALVEAKRRKTAVPISVWWLAPQYVVFGMADALALVGLQELFYDQAPAELRSVGLALYLSVIGVGNLLSGVLVSAIDKATGGARGEGWFSDDLNKGHLDYFYWLLAGMSAVSFVAYLHLARSYVCKRRGLIM